MFSRLFPRKTLFFDFFEQHAALITQAAGCLVTGISEDRSALMKIKALEHEADAITQRCVEALYKTFITPIDRDLIFSLIGRLDDIIDSIDAAVDCISVYKISEYSPDLHSLSTILFEATKQVQAGINELRNLKHGTTIGKACSEIYRLEHEADDILRETLGRLFEEETDARQIIKFKDIYEYLESATDHCADAANVMEGILLEND